MGKNLYIDASHPDETRIVLKSNNTIEEVRPWNKNWHDCIAVTIKPRTLVLLNV